jgi:hypothetical protein
VTLHGSKGMSAHGALRPAVIGVGARVCTEPVQFLSPGVSGFGELSGAHVAPCPRHQGSKQKGRCSDTGPSAAPNRISAD